MTKLDIIFRTLIFILIVILIYISEYICKDVTHELYQQVHIDTNMHLTYISDLLNKHNIKHWLMLGTLLGAGINGKIIKSDPDVDIGINMEDYEKVLHMSEEMHRDGYDIYKPSMYMVDKNKKNGKMLWSVSLKIKKNNKNVAELMFFTKFNDGLARRHNQIEKVDYFPSVFTFPNFFIDSFVIVELNKKKYLAPQHYDILLSYWYGSDWKNIEPEKYTTFVELDTEARHYNRNISYLLNRISLLPSENNKISPKTTDYIYTFPENQHIWLRNNF